jgi:hypothetical protein
MPKDDGLQFTRLLNRKVVLHGKRIKDDFNKAESLFAVVQLLDLVEQAP